MSTSRGWSSSVVLAIGLACAGPSCDSGGPPPAKGSGTGSAPAPKTQLDKAREKVTLLEAAAMRLHGEILVAEEARDTGKLLELKEKEIAIAAALATARTELGMMEAVKQQRDAAGGGPPPPP